MKTPSTPADPSEGVLTGVRRICAEAGIEVGDIRNILHGTTVATNAVLESKGARVGLIDAGFQQILHLARSQTPGPLAGWIIMIKPDPPASLADTREAAERMDFDNTVVAVISAGRRGRARPGRVRGRDADDRADQLVRERRARAGDRARSWSGSTGVPGHPLLGGPPEFREYERALTACMNSYVRPKVADYVNRLQEQLTGIGARRT